MKCQKIATEHSLHLTDLRGGATHQFRKAWERNALNTVAWEDLHQAQTLYSKASFLIAFAEFREKNMSRPFPLYSKASLLITPAEFQEKNRLPAV